MNWSKRILEWIFEKFGIDTDAINDKKKIDEVPNNAVKIFKHTKAASADDVTEDI